jgi:hypothetical protein
MKMLLRRSKRKRTKIPHKRNKRKTRMHNLI